MSKLLVQVERVEDLIGRADNYFGCDLCGKDSVDATAFACAEKKKPITNADRIRAMSDEELAHLLHSAEEHLFTGNLWNYDKWTEWLKQGANDE